jgi:hypothetical protein
MYLQCFENQIGILGRFESWVSMTGTMVPMKGDASIDNALKGPRSTFKEPFSPFIIVGSHYTQHPTDHVWTGFDGTLGSKVERRDICIIMPLTQH